jgi:hypothetical protein
MGRPAGIAAAARTATNGSKPMAEATPNIRTIDDLFQILVARDVPPFEAKYQIANALLRGKLIIDSHIATRAAIEPVHPQSWDRVLALAIRDNHLIVEPLCALNVPWQAYSFSISNPVVIDELWPAASKAAESADHDVERPPEGAGKEAFATWAYRKLFEAGELNGLSNKQILVKVCSKVGSDFTVGMSTLKAVKRSYTPQISRRSRSDRF